MQTYKKNSLNNHFNVSFKKFFFLSIIILATTSGWAQPKTILFGDNKISIKQAFDKIEQQTGYFFLLDQSIIDLSVRVELPTKSMTLNEALSLILKNTGCSYQLRANTVVIVKSPQKPKQTIVSTPINQTIAPIPTQVISGIVIDDQTGRILKGAKVSIPNMPDKRTQTDITGQFSFKNVPTGSHRINTSIEGYYTSECSVDVSKTAPLEIEIRMKSTDPQQGYLPNDADKGSIISTEIKQNIPDLRVVQSTSLSKIDLAPAAPVTPGIRLSRVPDPVSNNTMWIDQYVTQRADITSAKEGELADIVIFNFKEGRSEFDPFYMSNSRSVAIIHSIFSDPTVLQNINITVITGSASPEGNSAFNERLAADRALAVKRFIMSKYPGVERDRICTYSIGEDWDGLIKLVESDVYMPSRSEVLGILSLGVSNEQKLTWLKQLNAGETFRYLKLHVFPNLRGSVSCTFYRIDRAGTPTIEALPSQVDTLASYPATFDLPKTDTSHENHQPSRNGAFDHASVPYYISIKTNLLYDIVLLPNIAIEFAVGNRWSLELEGMLSWWETKNDKSYSHRIQSGGVEVRKWLGDKSKTPLTGHYLGIYGIAGTYDVKLGGDKGYLSDWSLSAGVTYGYTKALGKRINLELGVGVGYLGGDYSTYTFDQNNDRYPLEGIFQGSYFGLTKAKVSLVWLIGNGINNK